MFMSTLSGQAREHVQRGATGPLAAVAAALRIAFIFNLEYNAFQRDHAAPVGVHGPTITSQPEETSC
jgi:hypothetical protein